MNTESHQIPTAPRSDTPPSAIKPIFLKPGYTVLLLPRRLLCRSWEDLDRVQLVQPAPYRLLVMLPAHARTVVDKSALPERVRAPGGLGQNAASRNRPLRLSRLGRLCNPKVLCKRVSSRLHRLHGRRCRGGLLNRLRLERRIRCRCTKRLSCLGRGAGKGVGGLACGGALLRVRRRGRRRRRERSTGLLVHEHRLAERVGGLLWSLEPLEGGRRGVLEAGNGVLWD